MTDFNSTLHIVLRKRQWLGCMLATKMLGNVVGQFWKPILVARLAAEGHDVRGCIYRKVVFSPYTVSHTGKTVGSWQDERFDPECSVLRIRPAKPLYKK